MVDIIKVALENASEDTSGTGAEKFVDFESFDEETESEAEEDCKCSSS